MTLDADMDLLRVASAVPFGCDPELTLSERSAIPDSVPSTYDFAVFGDGPNAAPLTFEGRGTRDVTFELGFSRDRKAPAVFGTDGEASRFHTTVVLSGCHTTSREADLECAVAFILGGK